MAISKKSIKRRLWRGCREKGTLQHCWASLVAQRLKHLPAMWETWVWSLGREDPLEKEMATHCSNLAWKIPRMEEPGRLKSMGSQRVRHDWATNTFTFTMEVSGLLPPRSSPPLLSCFKPLISCRFSLVLTWMSLEASYKFKILAPSKIY